MDTGTSDQTDSATTVEDIEEQTNMSSSVPGHQQFQSQFENMESTPSSDASTSSLLAGLFGMLRSEDQTVTPCSELEITDMKRLAQAIVGTSKTEDIAKVMEEFKSAHPNMKSEAFLAHFPSKMNPLIQDLPPEQKFSKLMSMLNAFSAIDPVLGKAMENFGVIGTGGQPNSDMADVVGNITSNMTQQGTGFPAFLMTDGPFNEGMDELSIEELMQAGLDDFAKMAQRFSKPDQRPN